MLLPCAASHEALTSRTGIRPDSSRPVLTDRLLPEPDETEDSVLDLEMVRRSTGFSCFSSAQVSVYLWMGFFVRSIAASLNRVETHSSMLGLRSLMRVEWRSRFDGLRLICLGDERAWSSLLGSTGGLDTICPMSPRRPRQRGKKYVRVDAAGFAGCIFGPMPIGGALYLRT